MKDLIVIMPVYNEEGAIGGVLDSWVAKLDSMQLDYEIHPYNDGSKDRTADILAACVAKHPGKIVAHNKPNSGHGPTILQGYRENAEKAEWLFQIDSDDEMTPDSFDQLWNKRENCDFLTGQRDGRKQAIPRKIISAVSRLCVRIFYGKSVWDVNTPYRLMRSAAFKEIFEAIPADTFAPNVILSGMAARKKFRCFEMPVPQRDRQTGEVSIKKWKLFKAAVRSFTQTIRFSFTEQMGWAWWLAFSAVMISSLLAVCSWVHHHDSSVFVYVAQIMHRGGMPYIDVFDHKGPLLYWINYLSYFMGKYGVLLPQYLMWIAVFWAVWRWLKKELSATISCFALCIGAICAVWFNEHGGNLTETYAFPLILFPLLWLYDAAMGKKQFSLWKCFATGLCTGGILMLRPNMLAMPLTIALFLLVEAIRNKEWKLLGKQAFAGVSGLIITVLPFILWLVYKGALDDCWKCYILFNMEYARLHGVFPNLKNKLVFLTCRSYPFFLAGFFTLLSALQYFSEKVPDRKKVLFWNTVFLLISLVIFFVNPRYSHYFLPMIPALFLTCAIFAEKNLTPDAVRKTAYLIPLILMIFCCWINLPRIRNNFKYGFPEPNEEMQFFASYIGNETVSLKIYMAPQFRLIGNFETKARFILFGHTGIPLFRDAINQETLYPPDPFLLINKTWYEEKRYYEEPENGIWVPVAEKGDKILLRFMPGEKPAEHAPESQKTQTAQ